MAYNRLVHQIIPLVLAIVTFILLCLLLFIFINLINISPVREKIQILFIPVNVIIGMTIYLKTSVDFALFMGNLMHTNSGWKKRIAIEIGTALGNGFGTLLVLTIWFFFKQVPLLLAGMICVASLILLEMAQEGFEESLHKPSLQTIKPFLLSLDRLLTRINRVFKPLFSIILPEQTITAVKPLSFNRLLGFSLTIPFLLGLDDFAGYIPLFSIVNVFSFIIGVFLAHMLLNIGLFAFPDTTTRVTRNPIIVVLGSIIFSGLALVGFYDVIQIIISLLHL